MSSEYDGSEHEDEVSRAKRKEERNWMNLFVSGHSFISIRLRDQRERNQRKNSRKSTDCSIHFS